MMKSRWTTEANVWMPWLPRSLCLRWKNRPPQVSHGVSHQVYTTDQCTDLNEPGKNLTTLKSTTHLRTMRLHDSKDKQTLWMCKKKLLDCCWTYQWFNSYKVAKHFIKLLESMLNRKQHRWFSSSYLSLKFMLLPSANWLKRSCFLPPALLPIPQRSAMVTSLGRMGTAT